MSADLATASAAPVDGYPLPTMKVMGEFQQKMPLSPIERACCNIFEVVDWLRSPHGMEVYEAWAKKKLPENPIDATMVMKGIGERFLEQGRPTQA